MQTISDPSEKEALIELKSKYKLKDEEFEVNREGNVIKLNLYFKELRWIPKELKNFKNLQELDLGYNQIAKIERINTLKQLRKLTLEYNKIKKIEGLEGLYQLEELNLYGNHITKIEGLEDLNQLKKLDLGKNPLSKNDINILRNGGARNAVKFCKNVKSNKVIRELKEEFESMELITPKDIEFAISELEKRNEQMEEKNLIDVVVWIQDQLVKLNEILQDHENISRIFKAKLRKGKELSNKEILLEIKIPPSQLEYYKKIFNEKVEINQNDLNWLDDYTIKILDKFQKRDPTLAELVAYHGILLKPAKKIGLYLIQKGLISEFTELPKSMKQQKEQIPYVTPMEFDPKTPPRILRGFNFAGDSFKFFVKVENPTNFVFNDVNVKLILPETLEFDKKSPSQVFHLGSILPKNFKSAYYFIYPKTCQRSKINAQVEYKDIRGDYKVALMEPFEIDTCFGGIKPHSISKKEFTKKLKTEEKRTMTFPLKKGISKSLIWKKLQAQTTLDIIEKAENELRMFGRNMQGQDIGIDSVFIDKDGRLYFKSTVFGEAMKNIFGVLCDIHNALMCMREDHIIMAEYLENIILDIESKYENYERLNITIQDFIIQQNELKEKYIELINSGNVIQTKQLKLELLKINQAIRKSTIEQNSILENISDNIINVLENQENSEDILENMFIYIKEHLKTDWERIKGTWNEYKAGKIGKKELIKRALRGTGRKLLEILPRTAPALI